MVPESISALWQAARRHEDPARVKLLFELSALQNPTDCDRAVSLAVALRLETYGDPRGLGVTYERGTPVRPPGPIKKKKKQKCFTEPPRLHWSGKSIRTLPKVDSLPASLWRL